MDFCLMWPELMKLPPSSVASSASFSGQGSHGLSENAGIWWNCKVLKCFFLPGLSQYFCPLLMVLQNNTDMANDK